MTYSFQTFSVDAVLTAVQMNQVEANIRDHVHGQGSVATNIILGTPVTTTSGTSVDFTGFPSGTKRIVVSLVGVSVSGTSDLQIQLGTGGTPTTSGYLGTAAGIVNAAVPATQAFTAAMGLDTGTVNASVYHGTAILTLEDSSDNTWTMIWVGSLSNTARVLVSSSKVALAGALDMIRITSAGGAVTFDAGEINIQYET